MDNYLESSQLFQQLPFSFILMRTNDLICFQQLEQNFRFVSKLPDMRHRDGQESSVLDLVFTLDPSMVTDLEHLPPLGHSDHEVLLWSYICYSDPQVPIYSNETYNYFKGDYDALNDYLFTIDWDLLFAGNDININLNWNTFKDKIFEGCQKFIPMSSVVHKKSTPPWWTKSLARIIQKKRSLHVF